MANWLNYSNLWEMITIRLQYQTVHNMEMPMDFETSFMLTNEENKNREMLELSNNKFDITCIKCNDK